MRLFKSRPSSSSDADYHGGCSVHEVRGPARSTMKAADKDTHAHGKRMHGSASFYGGYVEARPKKK